jgi:predicted dehydrogenase
MLFTLLQIDCKIKLKILFLKKNEGSINSNMKKLNVAIIGQGRSGKNIHGAYFLSANNLYYNVKYVVEADEFRRKVAQDIYPDCKTFCEYTELYDCNDVDLVVNATFSEMHYPITKDLLLHGFNVLVEKPFGRSRYECDELIKIAADKGVTLAVFQQSFFAPFYTFAKETVAKGLLGDVKQVSIHYNGFARRWDWQTLQYMCAGGLYNTGPHPVGLALGFLDFDKNARVEFSRLGTALTSGDADDYAKLILSAPGKPTVDVEVISCDAYSDYNLKIMGSRGTFSATTKKYKCTYIAEGEKTALEAQERIITESCEAYIENRAKALGADVQVNVRLNRDQIPDLAEIRGNPGPEIQMQLQEILSEDLGIPKENQSWIWHQENSSSFTP